MDASHSAIALVTMTFWVISAAVSTLTKTLLYVFYGYIVSLLSVVLLILSHYLTLVNL